MTAVSQQPGLLARLSWHLDVALDSILCNIAPTSWPGSPVTVPGSGARPVPPWKAAVPGVPETAVQRDGSAVLAPADLLDVLGALADAIAYRAERAGAYCLDCACRERETGPCEFHADDLAQAAAYRAAAERLGDYR